MRPPPASRRGCILTHSFRFPHRYDGVEIMGSEGYFINQFLVAHTNKRTDEWGGAYENRMRLPVDIVKAVRQAVGDDFIIMYRLSMLDLIPDGSSWDEIVKVCVWPS